MKIFITIIKENNTKKTPVEKLNMFTALFNLIAAVYKVFSQN